MQTWSRCVWAVAAAVTLVVAWPPRARADEVAAPPSHLAPYNLDWLASIDPNDLPPDRPAICIVDSGVAVTPDTPADNPAGPILERLAIDGGSGEPEGTLPAQLHGTHMAMAAIAPQNDWGTVGMFPQGRVISVRALTGGATTFPARNYELGIDACLKVADRTPVAVISLSLACVVSCDLSPAALQSLRDRIVTAHSRGISVVAAAGNGPNSATQVPASVDGAFAVGAGSPMGIPCPGVTFDALVAVIGPACPVEDADPLTGQPIGLADGGASTATVLVSSLLLALRTVDASLTYQEAEDAVRTSATSASARAVDGDVAFDRIGESELVSATQARLLAAPASSPTPIEGSGNPPERQHEDYRHRLPRPRTQHVTWRRGRLSVRVVLPPGGVLAVDALVRRGQGTITRRVWRRSDANLNVAVRHKPQVVKLRTLPPPSGLEAPSRVVMLRRTSHAAFR